MRRVHGTCYTGRVGVTLEHTTGVVIPTELLHECTRPKMKTMAEENDSSATQLMRAVRDNPADPIAALLSALLIVAGVFKLPERLGITTGELAIILGAIGTVAAAWRGRLVARNGRS